MLGSHRLAAPKRARPPEPARVREGDMARFTSRPGSRKALAGFIVVALFAVVGIAWWARSRSAPAGVGASTTSVATVSVQTLSQSISATGTINPKVQSNLRFGSSGTVTAVDVKVGDTVTAGQQVAAIDTTDLQTALDLGVPVSGIAFSAALRPAAGRTPVGTLVAVRPGVKTAGAARPARRGDRRAGGRRWSPASSRGSPRGCDAPLPGTRS